MKKFAEVAHSEIQELKNYYDSLRPIPKYFFPGPLKQALESYNSFEINGPAVYEALFNTSWFFRHWPFFSFLGKFSASNQNPIALAFHVADGLYGLKNGNAPIKYNNSINEINYLKEYKKNLSWFGKMFFPQELAVALDNFKNDDNFLPLYKAFANNTNTWFFPPLNLFGQTPLMQAYRQFEAGWVESIAPSDKNRVFKLIANNDDPLARLKEITSCFFKNDDDSDPIDMNKCLEWLEKYPTLKIKDLLKLRHHASDAIISALIQLGDNGRLIHRAIGGIVRLPEELSNDPSYINAVIHHTQPDDAALTLRVFHKSKLLDTENDKARGLEFLKKNQSGQSDYDQGFLSTLRDRLKQLEGVPNVELTYEDKSLILKHSKTLFDPLTRKLWSAIPTNILYKSYKDFISICEDNASDDLVSKLISYFLEIPAVFNNVTVQLSPEYDRYTKLKFDEMVSDCNDSERLYNALPHLIRRNTEEAKEIIIHLLSDPAIKKKVCNFESEEQNAIDENQLTIRQLLNHARLHNKTIYQIIMNMRISSCFGLSTMFSATGDELFEGKNEENTHATSPT